MATHPHHHQSLGCRAPELNTLKSPVMVHQEDHCAFRSEGLGDPEKSYEISDEKSSPNTIKERPHDTEKGSVRF